MTENQKLREAIKRLLKAHRITVQAPPKTITEAENQLREIENAVKYAEEALATTEPEPLSDEQIDNLIHTKHFDPKYKLHESDKVCLNWYRLGLRDGERAHGIVDAAIDAAMAKGVKG